MPDQPMLIGSLQVETRRQLMKRLQIGNSTVYRYIHKGMPSLKSQGRRLFPTLDVDAWILIKLADGTIGPPIKTNPTGRENTND